MFNLLKIKIPKEEAQEVTEIESWTVSWEVVTTHRWGNVGIFNKVFLKEDDALEFGKQLKSSADLIKTEIKIRLIHN